MAAPSMYPLSYPKTYLVEFRSPELKTNMQERIVANTANDAITMVMGQHGFDIDVVNVTRVS